MTEVHDGVTEREGDTALESMVAAVGRLFALVFTPLSAETRLLGAFAGVAGFPETGKRARCQLLGHWWHISC